MRRKAAVGAGLVAMLVAGPASVAIGPAAAAPGGGNSASHVAVCGPANPGSARCHSDLLFDPAHNWTGTHAPGGKPPARSSFSGYLPSDLWSAYALGSYGSTGAVNGGAGATVAVIDAYDDPNAASDLAFYRSSTGLPACNTTTGAGCLVKVDQTGGTSYPSPNSSWAVEISLDVDMVSAICPNCWILLVEASSNTFANLAAAAAYAEGVSGVVGVSNSYGGGEFSSETTLDSSYAHAGVAVTASAGDSGYGVEYPAASPGVVGVGGTTLTNSSGVWSETTWSGTGSGCSAYEPNPGWQPSTSLCSRRTVGDVSADADPHTGVAVYDTYGEPGWLVVGGTSVASPIVASVFALAGNTSGMAAGSAASGLYGGLGLRRVVSGANAHHCTTYLCNAADSLTSYLTGGGANVSSTWYNGPTGNGTPQGTTGF